MGGKFLLLMSLFVTISCANEQDGQDSKRPALGNYFYDYQVNPEQLATTLNLVSCPTYHLLFYTDDELNEHMHISSECNTAFANGPVQQPAQPAQVAAAAVEEEDDVNNPVCRWDQCNLKFNDKESFYDHVNQNHNRKNEHNKFVCRWQKYDGSICDKRSPDASDFKKHIVTHTRERPFKCETCGRSFNRKDVLKIHMKNIHKPAILPSSVAAAAVEEAVVNNQVQKNICANGLIVIKNLKIKKNFVII